MFKNYRTRYDYSITYKISMKKYKNINLKLKERNDNFNISIYSCKHITMHLFY